MKNPLNSSTPLLPFLILLGLLFLMAGPPPAFAAADQLLDRIVATVNQSVITENQLDLAVADTEKNFRAGGTEPPPVATLKPRVLEQLIDSRLELQMAKDNGITADDADVDKAIQQIARQNNISTDELYKKVEAQQMDVDRWKKDIRDQIMIQKIQQQDVASTISLSQEEVDAFAKSLPPPVLGPKEYRLRDFLISLPDDPSESARATAEKLAATLSEQLQQKQKIDVSHLTIQDRGWETLADMPSAFAKQVARMKKDGISGPILTGNGVHVLHLTGSRQPPSDTPAPTPTELRKQLFEQKYEKALKKWVALLRSRATIQMHPDS